MPKQSISFALFDSPNNSSMNLFKTLALLAITFVSAELDHHRKPDCHCSAEEAKETVRGLQNILFANTQVCDYRSNLEMSLPNASFSTLDYYCANGCCLDEGSLQKWWSYYSCSDRIYYPVEPQDITILNNGTVVFSVHEVTGAVAEGDFIQYSYFYKYHWYPVAGAKCQFKLGLITGHSLQCPASLPMAARCTDGC